MAAGNGSAGGAAGFDMGLATSEVVECVYQITLFLIGTPVNLHAFWRQWRLQRRGVHSESRLVRLSLHLIVANLLVLCVYCVWRTYWLLNVVWTDGAILCKLYSFMAAFPFHLWSNMVTAIAFDMLCCIRYVSAARCERTVAALRSPLASYRTGTSRVNWLVAAAWLFAVLCAAPMVFCRGVVEVGVFNASGVFELVLDEQGDRVLQCYTILQHEYAMQLFNLSHVVTVFYVPLVIIVVCYIVIGLSLRTQMRERKKLLNMKSARATDKPRGSSSSSTGVPSSVPRSSASTQRSGSTPLVSAADHASLLQRPADVLRRQLQRRADAPPPPRAQSGTSRTKSRFLRITVLIIATYVLSWLPYQVLAMVRIICLNSYACQLAANRLYWVQAALIASACINPFLYRFKARSPQTARKHPMFANADMTSSFQTTGADSQATSLLLTRRHAVPSVCVNRRQSALSEHDAYPPFPSHGSATIPLHTLGTPVRKRSASISEFLVADLT